jgi:hypothetical protein
MTQLKAAIRLRKMGRPVFAIVCLLWAASLGGCATEVGPSSAELNAQWEAQNIYPASYKNDLLAFFRTYLNDPTHVRGAAVTVPQLKPVGRGPRYVVCIRYDARDSAGKYLGPKEGAALYVAGKLDRFLDVKRDVRDLCKDATYVPFPELERLAR